MEKGKTMKELLFSLTAKDFKVETFKGSGPGGQHRNKTETAVRITHPESGAVGSAQDSRSQAQNKQSAFKKLVESDKFKKWHKLECARRLGTFVDIEQQVEKEMRSENLKVEVSKDGKWVKEERDNEKTI